MLALRSGVFALVAGLGLCVAQPVGAASPTAVLEAFFEGANAILKTVDPFGDLERPRQAVRELVNEAFDFRGASALALGSAWISRTPEEQDEFVRLFAVFLERGFIGMIGTKASVSDGVKIQYVDESIGEEWAGVATSLLTRSGQELPVDYWFVRRGDRWKIQDVVIDGVSLIANYRSQFARVLAAYPYSEVLARLGASQAEAPAVVAAPAPQVAAPAPQVTVMVPSPPPPQRPAPAPQPIPTPRPIPVVWQNPWSASVAVPPPTVLAAPPVPVVRQHPRSASVAVPAPMVPASLSPRTFQEIHLTSLPSERSPSERVRAPVAAQVSEIRETSLPTRETQAAGAYWVQLGVFQSEIAAAHLAERYRRDGATISKSWLTNAAGSRVGVWARVRVGPFTNRSEAQSKLQELSARGQVGFIAEARD